MAAVTIDTEPRPGSLIFFALRSFLLGLHHTLQPHERIMSHVKTSLITGIGAAQAWLTLIQVE